MPMIKILKSLARYEIICKKHGEHKPQSEDLEDFVKNPKFTKETQCEDCGFSLQLTLDENDDDIFWITEI